MLPFRYFMPTEVVFAEGGIHEARARILQWGTKPLIVTGRHSARATGALDALLAQTPEAIVFDAVEANPSVATCDWAGARIRQHGCDVVVALGGGSPMDAAKAAAVTATNPGSCRDYFGADKYSHAPLPIVAIPTTAGTGSEVTPYAIITDTAENAKKNLAGRSLFPRVAILDPCLTCALPPDVTADTGLDALSQAMEGIVSRASTPWTDAIALEACALIAQWLPIAVKDGRNLEARGNMLYASCLAGCVIAHAGTTLVHGMGYCYTTECGVPHGRANALLFTPLFQFNAQYAPEKVAAIAQALGHPCAADPEDASKAIGQALHALLAQTGVPADARSAGVSDAKFADWARRIASDPYRFRNQPGAINEETIMRLFQLSHAGALLDPPNTKAARKRERPRYDV
ncbi:MAG TPA: iron-containing alcohol dehydrogenase [Candidatus Hydrogenedentes bacterium]|nr:iron-containing alcohol dehydrogenase [Candidatus Hydrogenedentota bacterium]HOS03334.1 iron-containing alcohol dehydrogenase [Candidatus Hydrogenedentota bacterium]